MLPALMEDIFTELFSSEQWVSPQKSELREEILPAVYQQAAAAAELYRQAQSLVDGKTNLMTPPHMAPLTHDLPLSHPSRHSYSPQSCFSWPRKEERPSVEMVSPRAGVLVAAAARASTKRGAGE